MVSCWPLAVVHVWPTLSMIGAAIVVLALVVMPAAPATVSALPSAAIVIGVLNVKLATDMLAPNTTLLLAGLVVENVTAVLEPGTNALAV